MVQDAVPHTLER